MRRMGGRSTQVSQLVFEKAINEAAWSEMYARLCRKMLEQISPDVQDEGIKDAEGKPIAGGLLFRKYLVNRCQEDFERGWFAKEATVAATASDDHTTKAAHKKTGMKVAELCFDESYAAERAQRQGVALVKFIGELFRLQMLTERIMHECVKKFLRDIENPEEEEIEKLCQLLKTVGRLLDTPKARAHMDVYFTRMKEIGESLNVSPRMRFMLQDIIELRDRKWVSRNAAAAPTTIAAVYELTVKERAAESFNRQISMSRNGSRRGDNQNKEHGPDGWAVTGSSSVPRAPPKAGDLSQFSKISKGPAMAMVMGPSDVFAASKRETLSRTYSSSNMFRMLSQNPELTAEASTKPSRSSNWKPSVDLSHDGVPEPAVQHKKLQLLPRSVFNADESMITPLEDERESAPIAMSEADVKKEIDRHVRAFFAVRNLEEADVYVTGLPHELCFRLVDNRQICMSRSGPRGGSEHDQEHDSDGWTPPDMR
ncbi:armadillo-type protein [Suillus placidus]|uniref:Armadillo-type protein n=1 Tax=Suillus placidus TaxID=48579 RepID=A0A9P6ZWP5_9AGAM|nr:armadillo-type protein [Suillus placidus]